jgi:uncharacterized protein YbjT (DUF2867 family)
MIAIIAGATGLTGKELVRQLASDASITEVRALVRKSGTLGKHPKIREVPLGSEGYVDLTESSDPILSGELYFCALGTTLKKAGSQAAFRAVDQDAVLEFAHLCKSRGGRYFGLVSSAGANARSPFFYPRVKGETEEAILKLDIPFTCISRPSFLIGDREESRPLERFSIQTWRAVESILPAPLRLRLGSPIENVAKHLIHEALVPSSRVMILEAANLN